MDAARDGLDRKGLTARHAIDLKPFRVARDNRADAFTLAELDGGDMGERDADAVDLTFLLCCQPHAAVIWATARDGFGESEAGQQDK
jgi:hypothetical protein